MAIGVMAMTPFRTHRFEQFRVLPGRENAIVFFGNSITNMFEWSEALGNDPRVLNRGVSGAMTVELLENTDIVTSLHP
ncbi:MAG: GDSL family lipase, partial [Muribaculaceae bacterium]|nr:GDSL family lipase [Muribaculaceae bacterium]